MAPTINMANSNVDWVHGSNEVTGMDDPFASSFNYGTEEGQFGAQRYDNHNITQIRVRDALKAGINPLAALGMSSNVTPTLSGTSKRRSGNSKRDKFFDTIGGVLGLVQSIASIKGIAQNLKAGELDLESRRIQNDILKQDLAVMQQPGLPHNSGSAGEVAPMPTVSSDEPWGSDSLLFRVAYDLNGDPRLVVNQDITENDSDNAGYRSSIYSAYFNGHVDKLSGHIKSDQLRMMLNDLHRKATGRGIMNLDRLYISPSEFGLVAGEDAGKAISWFKSMFGGK